MRDAGALIIATQMLRRPTLARVVRDAPLPKGMTFLLEIAAGDADALTCARSLTGDAPERLTEAACFFVEQVLFAHRTDCYRILGATSTASTADLRRHMALLMRWVHPDKNGSSHSRQIDRSVFVARITEAWQTLKTEERRAAYNIALRVSNQNELLQRRRRSPRLSLHRLGDDGLIGRLLMFLRGGK